jgi:hypothetical protein
MFIDHYIMAKTFEEKLNNLLKIKVKKNKQRKGLLYLIGFYLQFFCCKKPFQKKKILIKNKISKIWGF